MPKPLWQDFLKYATVPVNMEGAPTITADGMEEFKTDIDQSRFLPKSFTKLSPILLCK
jgi:hypothetical protein